MIKLLITNMIESSTSSDSDSVPKDIKSSSESDSPKDNADANETSLNTQDDNDSTPGSNNDSGNNNDGDSNNDDGSDNDDEDEDEDESNGDSDDGSDNEDDGDGNELKTTKDKSRKIKKLNTKAKSKANKDKSKTHKRRSRSVKKSKIVGGCSMILLIVLAFAVVNILNICAIGIGSANYYDDEGICQGRYGFPLSEWLIIVGCMGTFMTTGAVIAGLITESALGSNIAQLIWFLPEFALWCCGIVILNNLEDDSCKDEFRKVWDMSVAWCVLRGLGFFSLCCFAAG